MAVRLVAFDLDGTLLGGNDRVSTHTAAVLARARAAGLVLVAATGRGCRAARLALGATDAVDHMICSNGAVRYDVRRDEVVEHHPIDPEMLAALYQSVNQGLDGVCWAWETAVGIVPDCGFRALTARRDGLKTAPVPLRLAPPVPSPMRLPPAQPASKAMIAHPYLVGDRLLGRLRSCLPPSLSAASSSATFVEVTAPGIDKASGLDTLCRQLGVAPDEVMAFGDHLNDLSMLRWAGRGVAMANAHPRVLSAVVERTTRNVDDGVAAVIETLLAPS